jgi:hypothetical protein
LHRVFALQALLSGVTPWPASAEALEIYPILKPIGDLETCRFIDWRNNAVTLTGSRCASAVYSRTGESWLLLANCGKDQQVVECKVEPNKLPYPIRTPTSVTVEAKSNSAQINAPNDFSAEALTTSGMKLQLEADSVILLRLR